MTDDTGTAIAIIVAVVLLSAAWAAADWWGSVHP